MPSPLQEPSTRRKLIYFGLIFALLVANTFLWRGTERVSAALPWQTVTERANDLELRELNQGEPELIGSAVRLGLTGSRGLAVTLLWSAAIEKQKKNEWNELELLVRTLTKLQPHFLTPWLFQSWNLAYNVSVESDRVKDKYFYISRGIELLAQGERLNRDNPDMRFWIGFYYINKFGVADEANTLRSLFQLSCIEPAERDPARLRPDGRTVDEEAFARFVTQHPQLVRRLREALRYNSPSDVVDFLADNRKVPTRYVDPETEGGLFQGRPGDLKPGDQQFPALPANEPMRFTDARVTTSSAPTLGDDFDNFQAALGWFALAQDPLPDAEIMVEIKDRAQRLAGQKGRRLPRQPAEVIFRQYPARAQSYTAERLLKEGWFDAEGWKLDEGRSGRNRWFPNRSDTAVGTGINWAVEAWSQAFRMWRAHGERTGVWLDPIAMANKEHDARLYRQKYNLGQFDMGPDLREDRVSPELWKSMLAHRQLFFYQQSRQMTNFPHHYYRAFTEQDPKTVQGRKLLFQAEQLRKAAEPERAMAKYEEAFAVWKEVLTRYPDFRTDSFIQEETYEAQVRYLDLLREHRSPQLRPAAIVAGTLAGALSGQQGAAVPAQLAVGLVHGLVNDQKALPLALVGPFDGPMPDGQPWISSETVSTVRNRLGLNAATAPPPPPSTEPTPAQPLPKPAAPTIAQ